MVNTAANIWRNEIVAGVTSDTKHEPDKADIRAWGAWVEAGLNAGTLNGPWMASKTLLDADLAHAANTVGFVYTTSDIGTYVKSGASGAGSWTKILDFIPGYQFASGEDDGTSTANVYAIDATPAVSLSDGQVLISFVVPVTNTSASVTVEFNSNGTALAIKTASGNNPAIGGLVTGMPLFGIIGGSGTEFRMRSDQTSAAIQTAAEAALASLLEHYLGPYVDDAAATSAAGTPTDGQLYWNITTGTLRVYDTGTWNAFTIALNDGDVTTAKLANEAVTDAKVKSDAAIKASKLAFSQDEADTGNFPFRSVYIRLREKISVKDAGAVGDGSTDDTAAFQEAIDYAQTKSLRQVHVPAHDVSAYYKTTAQLEVSKPITFVGEHPNVTIGAVGLDGSAGEYMFHIDGTVAPDLEQVGFKNLTLRPYLGAGTRGNGVLFERASRILMEDTIIFLPETGVVLTDAQDATTPAGRGYGNIFRNLEVYAAASDGFVWDDFSGGGRHDFYSSSFAGCASGVRLPSNAEVSGVNFYGGGFEGCAQPVELVGTFHGFNFFGTYLEKNTTTNGYSVKVTPGSGIAQRGFMWLGGYMETDAEDYPFLLGGDGSLTSFEIAGIETEGYGQALVRKTGAGAIAGGQIRSNYLQNMTAVVSNGPLTATTLANNYNASGVVSS